MKTLGSKKIIFDIGANRGQNIDYYLAKVDIVIAIEANPILINDIRDKHSKSIKANRLFTENCVLTASKISNCMAVGVSWFLLHQNVEQSSVIEPVIADIYIKKKIRSMSILEL